MPGQVPVMWWPQRALLSHVMCGTVPDGGAAAGPDGCVWLGRGGGYALCTPGVSVAQAVYVARRKHGDLSQVGRVVQVLRGLCGAYARVVRITVNLPVCVYVS